MKPKSITLTPTETLHLLDACNSAALSADGTIAWPRESVGRELTRLVDLRFLERWADTEIDTYRGLERFRATDLGRRTADEIRAAGKQWAADVNGGKK